MLHDLGHAPLSHLGEGFYREKLIKEEIKTKCIYKNINFEEVFGEKSKGSPHEIMSCYCIIENLDNIFKKNINLDYEFIFRIITGNMYKKKSGLKDFWARNIIISIVNSSTIDVDKLDYLMRDNHMCGYPAPQIDIPRLFRSIYVKNKKICFSANGIPALQSIIDSRDMLYLWVYNHHIAVYTDYITSEIIRHLIKIEKKNGIEELYFNLFSPEAISKKFVSDSDIDILLKNKFLKSLNKEEENVFIIKNINRIFNREFLKPTWKTIYEYSDFLEREVVDVNVVNFIKNKLVNSDDEGRDLRVKIVKSIRKKLDLQAGDMFLITRSNKFYHKGEPSAFNVIVNNQERSLSNLLPQKDYKKFDNISFYIFGPKNLEKELKKTLIEVIKEELDG
ncbi:MAG: HD domain-containing protein [Cetobacterium sp.]